MNTDITQSTISPSDSAPPPPIVCWLGLDWADQKHCMVVRTAPDAAPKTHTVEHKPEVFDEFFLHLHIQHPQGRIAVAIEQARGATLYALLKFDFVVIYPINPRSLADYRRAFKISGTKDDPLDADLLCELICRHADRLRPLVVEDLATRQLRLLAEARRTFVEDRTLLSNRLGATLKSYYPLVRELFPEELAAPMVLEFLRRWPNLAKLKAAKSSTLRTFFYAHNSRSEERIAQRLKAIAQAKPLTEDPALVAPLQLQMTHLVDSLRNVQRVVAVYDRNIDEVFATHSEAWLFSPLPGAGPVLAPRLAAAFGTIRGNFESAIDFLCFSGVAPVRKQSGNLELIHFRYARPIFLHQTIVEFAKCSMGKCEWARLVYEHQLKKGKTKWAAIRVVAFKWVRILWRCWTDRQPYDEQKYLRSLEAHGVELFASLYGKPASTTTRETL
jgi:transposase